MTASRSYLRVWVACSGLVFLLVVVSALAPVLRMRRAEFFAITAGVFIAWIPVAWIRKRWLFRIGAVAFAGLFQLYLLYGGFPWVLVASLPVLAAAPFRAPPQNSRVIRALGTTLVAGLGLTAIVGALIVPSRGPQLTICFPRPATVDEQSPIYADRTDRGYKFLPGVDSVGGALRTLVEFEPFATDHEVETVIRRAQQNPLVVRIARGDRPC